MLSRFTNSVSKAARATGNTLTRKTLQNKINRAEAELDAAKEDVTVIENLKKTNNWGGLSNKEQKKRNSQLTKAKEKVEKLQLAFKKARDNKAASNFGKEPPNSPEAAAIKTRLREQEAKRLKTLQTQKTINTPSQSLRERLPSLPNMPKISLPSMPKFLTRSNSKTRNYNCKCTRKNTPVVNSTLSTSLDLSNQNKARIAALDGGKHKRRTTRRNKRKRGSRRN